MPTPEEPFASGAPSKTGIALAECLDSRLPGERLTRFAPAPTGALHLGHVVNAVYVWGLARALGGRVLLRLDLLLRDRLGNWAYQCVAAIDDAVQGVTLVVRGQDLLPSTGRQIRLARLIGRQAPPIFAHHPLIMKSASQKLSKSDGDSGIAELRAAGWSAAQVIGSAAALAGLTPQPHRSEGRGSTGAVLSSGR